MASQRRKIRIIEPLHASERRKTRIIEHHYALTRRNIRLVELANVSGRHNTRILELPSRLFSMKICGIQNLKSSDLHILKFPARHV